jgi:hypothetical protein
VNSYTHTHSVTHTHTCIHTHRRMREALCTLEVPYFRRTMALGSRTRAPWELLKSESPKGPSEEIIPESAVNESSSPMCYMYKYIYMYIYIFIIRGK